MSAMIQAIIGIGILITIISCGGGGGSDSENNTPSYNTAINKGLSGYLFSQDTGSNAYLINVSTGESVLVPNTDWNSQKDRFPSGLVRFRKRAIQNDHSAFLVNAINCKNENEDALSRYLSCIYLQDYNGNYLSGLELLYDVYELQLSYDRQHVALFRDFNPGSSGQEWLEIYNFDGTLLSDTKLESRKLRWLQNGSIMYLEGTQFVFTKPYSTEPYYRLTLPDNISNGGWLNDFDVSDDQSQVAFTIATDITAFTSVRAKAYVMNIDGSNIRLLADDPDGTPYITSPSWSPDGRWVLLEEGNVSGQDGNTLGTVGHLYAVPSEDYGKVFMLSINSGLRSEEVIPLVHDIDGPGPLTRYGTSSTGEAFEWIP